MLMEHLDIPFEFKAASDDATATFEGYGSVFGTVDSYADVVAPGAFKRTLAQHRKNGTAPALLWQHDMREPIGSIPVLKEDDYGLFMRGEVIEEVRRGAEAAALLRRKAVSGLSIGFVPVKWAWDDKTGIRTLTEIDLWEVSVVTFPANRDARVQAVKSCTTIREFEDWLRDAGGFSASQAKAIASVGFRGIAQTRDAAGGAEHDADVLGIIERNIQLLKG